MLRQKQFLWLGGGFWDSDVATMQPTFHAKFPPLWLKKTFNASFRIIIESFTKNKPASLFYKYVFASHVFLSLTKRFEKWKNVQLFHCLK